MWIRLTIAGGFPARLGRAKGFPLVRSPEQITLGFRSSRGIQRRRSPTHASLKASTPLSPATHRFLLTHAKARA
jgi:hypothetical protein